MIASSSLWRQAKASVYQLADTDVDRKVVAAQAKLIETDITVERLDYLLPLPNKEKRGAGGGEFLSEIKFQAGIWMWFISGSYG